VNYIDFRRHGAAIKKAIVIVRKQEAQTVAGSADCDRKHRLWQKAQTVTGSTDCGRKHRL
jgi:hypothetical protein